MVELAQFGFRNAGEMLDVRPPNFPKQSKFARFSSFDSILFPEWNPLSLIEKIKNNQPLTREDYLHPKLLQYSSWLERICVESRTATAKELLAVLTRSGRIRMKEYQILL